MEFIREQKIFHVASAPLNGGHVNVSPRGYQTFKLVNRKACWFLDLSGSGNETISHLYEPGNGRITILFEAFEGPPNIVRLYGKGTVYERGTPEFDKFFEPTSGADDLYDFPTPEMTPGARAVIWIDITRVGSSCGYSVPFMQFVKEREQLNKWSARLEEKDAETEDPWELHFEQSMKKWWSTFNTWSIDGLPGMKRDAERYDPEGVREVMKNAGLKTLEPPSTKTTASRTKRGVGELNLVLFGVVLGVTFMSVAQSRLRAITWN